jgi:hypothetical protein
MQLFPIRITAIIVLGLALHVADRVAADVPAGTSYQGFLLDVDGTPRSGSADIVVRIWTDAISEVSDDLVYAEGHEAVPVVDGIFSVVIGEGSATFGIYDSSLFAGPSRWLELEVEDEKLAPRQRIYAAPYAVHAARCVDASLLSGLSADELVAAARSGLSFADVGGVVSDAQVADSITRDGEVLALVVDASGPGSRLDADSLDGVDAASFLRSDQAGSYSGAQLTVEEGSSLQMEGSLSFGTGRAEWADGRVTIDYDDDTGLFHMSNKLSVVGIQFPIADLRYFSIAGNSLQDTGGAADDWNRQDGYGWMYPNELYYTFYAPIHIQAGRASIFELRCYHWDKDPSDGADLSYTANVRRRQYTGAVSELTSLSASTTGSTSAPEEVSVSLDPPVEVDNEQYYYYLQVNYRADRATPSAGSDRRRFIGCRVGYWVEEL